MAGHTLLLWQKMKVANEKEDRFLKRRVREIMKNHAENMQDLHKEKCQVVAELRSHKIRKLRSYVRSQHNDETDAIDLTRNQPKNRDMSRKQSSERSKLISKVHFEGDEDHLYTIYRSRTLPEFPHRRPSLPMGTRELSRSSISYGTPFPNTYEDTTKNNDSVFCIFFNPGGEFETSDHKSPRHKKYGTLLPAIVAHSGPIKVLDGFGHRSSLAKIPKAETPSYVQQLKCMRTDNFDQFTDGTMALEMRRSRQIQREQMPPLSGHLPVRMRYGQNYDMEQRMGKIQEKVADVDPESTDLLYSKQITLGALDPTKAKHYKHKLKSEEIHDSARIQEDNEKLNKLVKASQIIQYKETLTRVDSFIGSTSKGSTLVQEENLTKEESFMLKTLTSDPKFQTK